MGRECAEREGRDRGEGRTANLQSKAVAIEMSINSGLKEFN